MCVLLLCVRSLFITTENVTQFFLLSGQTIRQMVCQQCAGPSSPSTLQDFRVLSFNIGHRDADRAKQALIELLRRTEPVIVALQESPWRVGGHVLQRILNSAFPGSIWSMEEVRMGSRSIIVLYSADRFRAVQQKFDLLGIDPPDRRQRVRPRHPGPWLQSRYMLLQLTSCSEPDVQFYLLNWHGPKRGLNSEEKAHNTLCLLERAALLVQRVSLHRVVGCLLMLESAH